MKNDFERKLDKKRIPVCNILGVDIAAVNMDWLLKYIKKNISALSGDYMCVSNVHTTVTAFEDPECLEVQNGGIMAIPDGGPLSSVGRKRGHKNMERITGPGFMGQIFQIDSNIKVIFEESKFELNNEIKQFISIECSLKDKIKTLIEKYYLKTGNNFQKKLFFYENNELLTDLTVEEGQLYDGCKIKVVNI